MIDANAALTLLEKRPEKKLAFEWDSITIVVIVTVMTLF